ncbi:hypothetical protein AWT69_000824 [Pseudomonas putida]|nr:hypothetical protein AWT69_000824 [Pseudomonas putida]
MAASRGGKAQVYASAEQQWRKKLGSWGFHRGASPLPPRSHGPCGSGLAPR